MRCFVIFVTAVCILFLLKLKWPKNKSFYDLVDDLEDFFKAKADVPTCDTCET